MLNETLQLKISQLPDSPGCYLMKSGGEIIYVGKAKNLKNRVRQYFHSPKGHTTKVQAMVDKVDDFEIVLVDRELEALILENNLIKRHKPYYNILLKDDKQYPYLAIDLSEDFPRIQFKRKPERNGLKYFGPYQNVMAVQEVLDAARMVFPIRVCKGVLRPDPKNRPCVHHQIGQCLAPCTGAVPVDEYRELMRRVMEFLQGKTDPIMNQLKAQMAEAAQAMNYERAAIYRDRIRAVESVVQKQKALSVGGGDQDVIVAVQEGVDALVQLMIVRAGKLIGAEHFVMERAGDEQMGDVLTSFMLQRYADQVDIPRDVLLSDMPDDAEALGEVLSEARGAKVELLVPQRGDKRKLVDMALKNAMDMAQKRTKRLERSYSRTHGALIELANILGLREPPRRIEGYDISNTQGDQSVGAMVVQIDGVAAPREYRIFKIKTVEGANDYASHYEVMTRRLRHGREEREAGIGTEGKFSNFPDVILIDGGKGQLKEAMRAMHDQGFDIPVFALAERIDEIYVPGEEESIYLDRHSEALHLVQRVRDEAHRFGITHHRKLRAKKSIASSLDVIPGVGPKKKKAMLKAFKTIEQIKTASAEELGAAEGVGPALGRAVYAYFHPEAQDNSEEDT